MPGYRKLGRESAHRKAMLRNLVTDLLREGRIQTTEHRAKETKKFRHTKNNRVPDSRADSEKACAEG